MVHGWKLELNFALLLSIIRRSQSLPLASSLFQAQLGEREPFTLRAPHWDVRNNYLCLAATQDPSGEVIMLTRGCSLQSQLIHINSEAWATRAIWMHGFNYTHYWTRQGPRNWDFLFPVAQQQESKEGTFRSVCHKGKVIVAEVLMVGIQAECRRVIFKFKGIICFILYFRRRIICFF